MEANRRLILLADCRWLFAVTGTTCVCAGCAQIERRRGFLCAAESSFLARIERGRPRASERRPGMHLAILCSITSEPVFCNLLILNGLD